LVGSTIAHYRITAPLGAGGMGEVYRATDTKLGREVAVKVLPADVAGDADRLARLEREARAVAALSHPNILSVYELGCDDGTAYVVTELLEGETLRARLDGGPLPVRKVTEYAAQVARGLAAAHDKGIVHRDLKPENLFLTHDGRVKILDFGLARHGDASSTSAASDTRSPTLARPTDAGTVLGTVGYMSPEQARGHVADARSDIFSLGCVVHEMLTGRRAFQRETAAEAMTAILREDAGALPESCAPGLARVVERCLEKQPAERFQSAQDLAFTLASLAGDSAARSSVTGLAIAGDAGVRRRTRLALVLAGALVLVVVGFLAGRLGRSGRPAPALFFERVTSEPGVERSPALSPDGKTLAYVRSVEGRQRIFVQRVGSDRAIDLSAESPANDVDPVFSPDGSLIAFRSQRDGGGLFVMGPLGESVRRVTEGGFAPDFTPDGKEIVFAEHPMWSPLLRGAKSRVLAVELATGKTRLVAGPDAVEPAVSPHGLRVAFWSTEAAEGNRRDVHTAPLAGLSAGERPLAVTSDDAVDFSPFWSADGRHLYFGSDRGGSFNLWRIAIDEASGRTRGDPEPVTLPITWAGSFAGSFRASRSGGSIAFPAPTETMTIERLTLDPATLRVTGGPVPVRRSSTLFDDLRVSPDGQTIATRTIGRAEDVCLLSADGRSLRRLTSDRFRNRRPVFTPDGRRVVFYSNREGAFRIFSIALDGSGLRPVTEPGSPQYLFPLVSPDGRLLAASSNDGRLTVRALSAGPDGAPVATGPKVAEFPARFATGFSPDGRFLIAGTGPGAGGLLCSIETSQCEDLGLRNAAPQFTLDGRAIVFLRHDGLCALDLASRAARLVHPIADGDELRFTMSPDGRSVYLKRIESEADIWVGTFR
jgi:Tol biopolymer transport system component